MSRGRTAAADVYQACIEAFAASEAAAIDRIVDLICDRDAYRLLAQQLLHALHRAFLERDQINQRYQRLNQEYSKLREGRRQP